MRIYDKFMEVVHTSSTWRKHAMKRPRPHGELPYFSETLHTNLGTAVLGDEPNGD